MDIIDINEAKKKYAPKRRWRWPRVILCVAVLIILIMLISAAVRYFSYLGLHLTPVEQARIELTIPSKVVVIRAETVVSAPTAGEFVPAASDGEKVHSGTLLGNIITETGSKSVTADRSGLVYYQLDGWEDVLLADELLAIDWTAVFDRMYEDEQAVQPLTAEPDNIGSDRPVARIVDNLEPVYLCVYVEEDVRSYLHDDKLYLRFPQIEGDTAVIRAALVLDGELEAAVQQNDDLPLSDIIPEQTHYLTARVLNGNSYFDTFRYVDATVIGETISGISVPVSALTNNEEDGAGVYVSKRKTLEFREVTVIYQNDEIAIVDGLSATDIVAADPRHARAGQKIY